MKAIALNILSNSRQLCLGVAAVSVLALGFAFFMQYGAGLEPCHLCLLQRWPYGANAVLGLIGWMVALRGRPRAAALAAALAAVVFLGEGVLAFYHVGVEQHWWRSAFEGCTFKFGEGDLLAQIEARPAARCDEIPWSLFGVSMAGWNMVLALFLSALTLTGAILSMRRTNGLLKV